MSAASTARRDTSLSLELMVNGRARSLRAEPRTHLADVLRDGLDFTGTHLGCEHGVCGACTVLLDGEPARACLTFSGACAGAEVTTIEGLDDDAIAAELRAAFNREHALQCGYCTPGMLIAARDLVLRLPEADERRIRAGLSGNLCRCTGYVGIVRAVRGVIAERRARGIGPTTGGQRGLGPVGARDGHGVAAIRSPVAHARPVSEPQVVQVVEDFEAAHRFEQIVTVAHPPETVFALFGNVEAVAACLPGAALTGQPAPDTVEGALEVRIGPIAARFRGRARLTRDAETLTGRILGAGSDAGGRSATQGEIRYRVEPGAAPGTARIVLAVGYTLKGPLAQFGRPGLVRDLAGRIGADFAANLGAHLSGAPAPAPAGLNPLRLLVKMLTASLRRRLAAWGARRP